MNRDVALSSEQALDDYFAALLDEEAGELELVQEKTHKFRKTLKLYHNYRHSVLVLLKSQKFIKMKRCFRILKMCSGS